MSAELIGILSVGIAVAALILTRMHSLHAEMRADREEMRAEYRYLRDNQVSVHWSSATHREPPAPVAMMLAFRRSSPLSPWPPRLIAQPINHRQCFLQRQSAPPVEPLRQRLVKRVLQVGNVALRHQHRDRRLLPWRHRSLGRRLRPATTSSTRAPSTNTEFHASGCSKGSAPRSTTSAQPRRSRPAEPHRRPIRARRQAGKGLTGRNSPR